MDFGTLFGMLAGIGLIGVAMWIAGGLSAYADLASALIVVGGTIAVAFVTHRAEDVLRAFGIAAQDTHSRGKHPGFAARGRGSEC